MKKLPWFALLALTLAVPWNGCSSSGSKNGGSGGEAGEGEEGEGGSNEGGQAGGQPSEGGSGGTGGSAMAGSGGKGGSAGGGGNTVGGAAGGTSVNNKATCVPPKLKLTRMATANEPMAVAQAPGDPRMFVVERAGLVRILRNTTFDAMPFLDIRSSVLNAPRSGTHERGLLNFVLHPQFKDNGRFYVFYTRRNSDPLSQGIEGATDGAIVIAEGQQDGTTNKAKRTLKILATASVSDDHHLGGFLGIGPDGMLYAGIGDGGGGWDASKAGQDPKGRVAKILRINPDNPSMRPANNLSTAGADPLTWAYGVRNPFRGSFDSLTGDLYFGDVGEMSYEEVNFVPPGSKDINFGWGFDDSKRQGEDQLQSGMEGLHPFPWYTIFAWAPFGYLPIHEYPHDGSGWEADPKSYMKMGFGCTSGTDGGCAAAVVGGVVYRGKSMPGLDGRYFYGDHVRNKVMSFIVKDKAVTCQADLTSDLVTSQTRLQGISGFGTDGNGEIYILDIGAGNIYRIDAE